MRRGVPRGAVVALLTATLATGPIATTPAYAAPVCTSPVTPGALIRDPPWAQQRFTPDRLAPFADGSDVLVAVLDSGVDRRHSQLAGRVRTGRDFLDGGSTGAVDCDGHGTGVSSLIVGGNPPEGVSFRGLAPGARIIPVRVSEKRDINDREQGNSGDTVSPEEFAAAIRWAVSGGADVLNLSLVLEVDHPDVRAAIEFALAKDVVVVAAVGNRHAEGNPRPYPASYDGVLGVGAVDRNGIREDYSQTGSYVDIVAPGGDIIMAAAGGGYRVDSGTSFATPFVAATAALVRDYWDISAKEVVRRIVATADPAAGGQSSDGYGAGIVNPYRAVTEAVAERAPEAAKPLPADDLDPAGAAARKRESDSRRTALAVAGAGGAVAAVALIMALVLPRGIRRRWRPAEPT